MDFKGDYGFHFTALFHSAFLGNYLYIALVLPTIPINNLASIAQVYQG